MPGSDARATVLAAMSALDVHEAEDIRKFLDGSGGFPAEGVFCEVDCVYEWGRVEAPASGAMAVRREKWG